jgi:hypothetical protein
VSASIVRTGGVVTVTTATPVTLTVGASVTIAGTGSNTLNGTKTVTAVVSPTVFRYTQGNGNTGQINNTGTVTFSTGSIYPVPSGTTATCKTVGMPVMANNIVWQNRAFHVDITTPSTNPLLSQQNIIALTPALTQTATGACPTNALDPPNYWDIGIRQDDLVSKGGLIPDATLLTLNNSILSDSRGWTGTGNIVQTASPVIAAFCNGARVPPEHCAAANVDQATCHGYNAPPGRSETTGLSQLFQFSGITPAATVDEGHNWLNLTYGPLTLNRATLVAASNAPELMVASAGAGTPGGAYSIASTSPAINTGLNFVAPATDFFGNTRARTAADPADIGAVEGPAPVGAVASVAPTALTFSAVVGTTSAGQALTLTNSGNAALTITAVNVTAPFLRPTGTPGGTCTGTLAAAATCTINVVFAPTVVGPAAPAGSVTINASVAVTGSPVTLNGTGVAPPTKPTLTVLDNFNRAAASTLGPNWSQFTIGGIASIRLADATTGNVNTGLANANLIGNGYWNVPPTGFGTTQGASFAIANATINGDSLILKASGTVTLGVAQNFIRVRVTATQVIVETTTNNGLTTAAQGTFAVTFALGDTLTAVANIDGSVDVWKTTAANVTTYVGRSAPVAAFAGTGRIGIQLPTNARIDDFAGGTVP